MKHYVAIKDGRVIGHLYAKNIEAARTALHQKDIEADVTLGYKLLLEDRLANAPVLFGEKPTHEKKPKLPPEGVRVCFTVTNLAKEIADYLNQQPSKAKHVKKLIEQDYKKNSGEKQ